jgi:hypothetical protein
MLERLPYRVMALHGGVIAGCDIYIRMTINSAALTPHDTMWERTIGPIFFHHAKSCPCDDSWSIKKVLFFCCVTRCGRGLLVDKKNIFLALCAPMHATPVVPIYRPPESKLAILLY